MAAPRLGLAVLVVVVVSEFPRYIATAVSPSAEADARDSCADDDTRSCEVANEAAVRANSMLQMSRPVIKPHAAVAKKVIHDLADHDVGVAAKKAQPSSDDVGVAVAAKKVVQPSHAESPAKHSPGSLDALGALRAVATPAAAAAKNGASAANVKAADAKAAAAPPKTAERSASRPGPVIPLRAAAAAILAGVTHDVHHHGSRHGSAERGRTIPGKMADQDGAFSFIQTDDSLLETASVTDVDTADDPFPVQGESHFIWKNATDEVRSPWRNGVVDAAALVSVVVLVAWIVCFLVAACGRPCFIRISRKCKARKQKTMELPKPEPIPLTTFGFQEPLLPQTGYTYSIPLAHHTEAGSSKPFCFNIPRRQEGPQVSAIVTCQPEGSTRAKVQLFAGEGGDFTSPLASCCLVHSTSDVESMNIQGAMMSWLSLLIDEKEDDAVTTGLETSGSSQQSRVCTSLHGIAEDLMESAGSGEGASSGKDASMRLEVRDSLGFAAGTLEAGPESQPGHCVLMRHGIVAFEIKATPDSIVLSKKDEVVALATHLGIRRNPELPELPELTGEYEHLQVDIRQGTTWTDVALFLNCILAVVVFKPKAIPKDGDTEAKVQRSSLEIADTEPSTGAPQPQQAVASILSPPQTAYYQRAGFRSCLLPTTPLV